MNGNDELSLKDITFLRAIRDINGSPERYASTEQGVTPATVTAITEATTLSEEEVEYRLDHPRLGKSGLVTVYEAGPPSDDSASLNSAELTEAGEQAIAEAEHRERSADAQEWQPDETQSEFDDMQEWEPADVESGDAATVEGVSVSGTTASSHTASATARTGAEPPMPPRTDPTGRTNAGTEPTTGADETDDRLAALETRIEQLEAENGDSQPDSADDERVDELADEVAALRKTTDRLESTLDDALDELDAISDAEYGAIDERREKQFETAVKSMVAFHQLATEVLDVRVENYEPSAGRADPERVEITRNRIGDALGVGKSGGGGGTTLGGAVGGGDSDWPDPEEAARGGRVFSADDDVDGDDAGGSDADSDDTGGSDADEDETMADEPESESAAPDSGVYPPIGEDAEREAADEPEKSNESESAAPESDVYPPIGGNGASEINDDSEVIDDDVDSTENESEVPDSDIYPPIGEDRDDGPSVDDAGELPESVKPDEGSITETAVEEGHVVDPIRSTGDDHATADPPLDIDAETTVAVRCAVVGADEQSTDPWRLSGVDPERWITVRDAAVAARTDGDSADEFDDPYPDGEAYARIVGEAPVGDSSGESDLPAVPSAVDDPAKVRMADGQGPESPSSEED